LDEQVIPVLYVEDAARAVAWYDRLGFRQEWEHQPGSNDIDAVSEEFGIPVDEEGLAGRECDLEDPDGNRLRVATPRS
jgi:hypothetical protein